MTLYLHIKSIANYFVISQPFLKISQLVYLITILLTLLLIFLFLRHKPLLLKTLFTSKINSSKKSYELKENLISVMAHDLKGPVASFQCLASLINYHLVSHKYDELYNITTQVECMANNLNLLVDNYLSWFQMDKNQKIKQATLIDLGEIIAECYKLYESIAQMKNVILHQEISDETLVYADLQMTKSIICNLISNSIKFTKPNGLVTIKAYPKENYSVFVIEDNGIGMNSETIDKIMLSNYYTRSEGTTGEKGSGLGLKICNEFVKLNKGTLTINSQINLGTQVKLTLPRGNFDKY